jgi:hypothetical protein
VTGTDGSRAGIITLASGQAGPGGIAVDDTSVYWINIGRNTTTNGKAPMPDVEGQIMKCAIGGCNGTPSALANGLTTFPESTPIPLVVAAGNVYWNELFLDGGASQMIAQVPTTAQGVTPVALTAGFAWAMASDGRSIYWTTNSGVSVMACALSGCAGAPLTLWTGLAQTPNQLTTGVAVDDQNVYWATEPGNIMKCAKSDCGGTTTVIAYGPVTAAQIAIDATNVYWTTSQPKGLGGVFQCPKAGCDNGPTTLVSGLSSAYGIATDGVNVYWAELGDGGCCVGGTGVGRIAMCAVSGRSDGPRTLAGGLSNPEGIAVDAKNVYWTTSGPDAKSGQVMMMAK